MNACKKALKSLGAMVLFAVLATQSLHAQDFPQRAIRLVVPFAPGGSADAIARLVGAEMARILGQPVIVDNRAGAAGTVGTAFVAKSAPDGYTLIFAPSAAIAILPGVSVNVTYDPARDLVPVTQVYTSAPFLISVRSDFPANSVQQLVERAKASPGRLTYSHSGKGGAPHLAMELLEHAAGIDMIDVPFKGEGPAVQEVLAGRVDVSTAVNTSIAPHVATGAMKVLAQFGDKRSTGLPGVPTVVESGYPGTVATSWIGVHAPAGTPPAIVTKLQRAIAEALAVPHVQTRMATFDAVSAGTAPEAYAAFVREETRRWQNLIRTTGLKFE